MIFGDLLGVGRCPRTNTNCGLRSSSTVEKSDETLNDNAYLAFRICWTKMLKRKSRKEVELEET